MSPREAVASIEREAPLLDGTGDRFSGYAVVGLSFESGHVLALRRFPASSIGPGYTSVWHRDPRGRWTFYSTVAPECSCARYFGAEVAENVTTPIAITWTGPMTCQVTVGTAIVWHLTLRTSWTTRLLNAVAALMPEWLWQEPAVLHALGVVARVALGTGPMSLTGHTPNGQVFVANPRRLWLVDSSWATLHGVALGPVGALPRQVALGDIVIPRRGLFVEARTRLEEPAGSARSTISTSGRCPAA